jgi:hypothetical protein
MITSRVRRCLIGLLALCLALGGPAVGRSQSPGGAGAAPGSTARPAAAPLRTLTPHPTSPEAIADCEKGRRKMLDCSREQRFLDAYSAMMLKDLGPKERADGKQEFVRRVQRERNAPGNAGADCTRMVGNGSWPGADEGFDVDVAVAQDCETFARLLAAAQRASIHRRVNVPPGTPQR